MKKGIIRRRFVWSLLTVFSLLVIFQTDALACRCIIDPNQTLEQRIKTNLKSAKAAFSGKVIEIYSSFRGQDALKENILVKMKVKESWKDILPEEIEVITNNSSSCGYRFEKGKSYLIFAYLVNEFQLQTSKCLQNRELEQADEELKILGKGKTDKIICPTIKLNQQDENLPKNTQLWSVKILNAEPNLRVTYEWEYWKGGKQSTIKSENGASQITIENVDLFKGLEVFVKVGGLPTGCPYWRGRGVIN